jgi:glycosyltransferase involved in cell wall biosynthesis
MPSFYACSDVLVASLKKENIFELTIPSKIQSYLACAKPILASLDGEGARIVEESGAGLSSPAEDAELLALQAEKMFRMNGEQREEMGKNAIKYFKKEFERDMLLEKLVTILQNR